MVPEELALRCCPATYTQQMGCLQLGKVPFGRQAKVLRWGLVQLALFKLHGNVIFFISVDEREGVF